MFVEEIQLVNGTNIRPGLFNVFIGGNGVGKTTLLIELFARSPMGPANDGIGFSSLRLDRAIT